MRKNVMANEHQYVKAIRSMLELADPSRVTAKKIRNALEKMFDVDISPHKGDIDALIMKEYDGLVSKQHEAPVYGGDGLNAGLEPHLSAGESPAAKKMRETKTKASRSEIKPGPKSEIIAKGSSSRNENGAKRMASSGDNQTIKIKQKRKRPLTDEEVAAQLHAEPNGTRRNSSIVKPKSTLKRKKRLTDEVSSPKQRRQSTGLQGLVQLSEPLAAMIGEDILIRTELAKRLWQYIHENGLQDATDRRYINCDATMQRVFGVKRVHMFTMNRILKEENHVVSLQPHEQFFSASILPKHQQKENGNDSKTLDDDCVITAEGASASFGIPDMHEYQEGSLPEPPSYV